MIRSQKVSGPKTSIRFQKLSDARRFFEILTNPNFKFLDVRLKSVAEERRWLARNPELMKNNTEWNYTILRGKEIRDGEPTKRSNVTVIKK